MQYRFGNLVIHFTSGYIHHLKGAELLIIPIRNNNKRIQRLADSIGVNSRPSLDNINTVIAKSRNKRCMDGDIIRIDYEDSYNADWGFYIPSQGMGKPTLEYTAIKEGIQNCLKSARNLRVSKIYLNVDYDKLILEQWLQAMFEGLKAIKNEMDGWQDMELYLVVVEQQDLEKAKTKIGNLLVPSN